MHKAWFHYLRAIGHPATSRVSPGCQIVLAVSDSLATAEKTLPPPFHILAATGR